MFDLFNDLITLCMSCSLELSRLLVASSRMINEGLPSKALVRAILCFSPPLNPMPCSPNIVSYFLGSF